MIVGFEGEEESVARRRALAVRALRAGGAAYLGQAAGRSWEHGRYQRPLPARHADGDGGDGRDARDLAHLDPARRAARRGRQGDRRRARGQGTPGLVWCHLSHAYADGASLYFTFISRRRAAAPSWSSGAQVKRAACEAIVASGGTITHHHAVGRDHAPYMAAEVGETGIDVLRAVKEQLDPAGIMNPGKLLPELRPIRLLRLRLLLRLFAQLVGADDRAGDRCRAARLRRCRSALSSFVAFGGEARARCRSG